MFTSKVNLHLNYGLIGCSTMGHEHLATRSIGCKRRRNSWAGWQYGLGSYVNCTNCPAVSEYSITPRKPRSELSCDCFTQPLSRRAVEPVQELLSITYIGRKPLFTSPDDLTTLNHLLRHSKPAWVAMEYRYMPPCTSTRKKQHYWIN